jgi:hypothetical protein
MSLLTYFTNVYEQMMVLFENVKHLSVIASSVNDYPPFLFCHFSPDDYLFSTVTVLCINVLCLDDCLFLLDGRMKQLSTFIVQVQYINCPVYVFQNMVSLNLEMSYLHRKNKHICYFIHN